MRNMTRWAIALCALMLAATFTTACSDDEGSGVQGDVADQTIEQLSEGGVEVDEDCIRELADELSDDDAQALLDNDLSAGEDLSAEGQALGEQIFGCVSIEDIDLGDLPDGSDVDTTEGG